jgi:hypothetical protein
VPRPRSVMCARAGYVRLVISHERGEAGFAPADADEIFDLRLACVRAIVRIIYVSASSKLAKR